MTKGITIGDRSYHLTNEYSWKWIQRRGLIPMTISWNEKEDFSKEPWNIDFDDSYFWNGGYIVCSITKDFSDWKEHDLYESLIAYVKRKDTIMKNRVFLLSFPIIQTEGVYVRDHTLLSPKVQKERFGKNLRELAFTHEPGERGFRGKDFENWRSCFNHYVSSTTELDHYDGSFELPEVWYPHKVPVEQITLEEVLE